MMPIRPIGTRILPTSMPLGLRHIFKTSPTGSGRAATSRSPSAIVLIRSGVSVSRSIMALERPFFSDSARSLRFSEMRSPDFCSRPSAILNSALFFISVEMLARTRDAALAFSALPETNCLISTVASYFLQRAVNSFREFAGLFPQFFFARYLAVNDVLDPPVASDEKGHGQEPDPVFLGRGAVLIA